MQSVAEELFGPLHGVALRAESFLSGGRRASEHRVQQDAHAHAAGESWFEGPQQQRLPRAQLEHARCPRRCRHQRQRLGVLVVVFVVVAAAPAPAAAAATATAANANRSFAFARFPFLGALATLLAKARDELEGALMFLALQSAVERVVLVGHGLAQVHQLRLTCAATARRQ